MKNEKNHVSFLIIKKIASFEAFLKEFNLERKSLILEVWYCSIYYQIDGEKSTLSSSNSSVEIMPTIFKDFIFIF